LGLCRRTMGSTEQGITREGWYANSRRGDSGGWRTLKQPLRGTDHLLAPRSRYGALLPA
jgi:hypothetical protein